MKFSSNVRTFGLLGFGAALLAGCAGSTPPPRELVDARAAFARAQQGPAQTLEPGALGEAKTSLNRAESAYAASAETSDIKTLAYVAQRKSELADIQAQDALNVSQQKQAEMEIQQITAQQLGSSNQRLQQEQEKRADAERRAREALQGAQVTEDSRGLVITLPGQVLFQTGKSSLMPSSRQKLSEVADVLKDQPDRNIIVEGHTDSTGTPAKNDPLSLARAEEVKQYLVSRGVPAMRISARGFGASHPVANNDSPEGRANNRRVEIVIQPPNPTK